MSNQIIRPLIPYRGGVPGGLSNGKLIQIRGTIPYGSDGFEVNLMTGFDTFSDRALSLSVRLSGGVVIRNSLERNSWGFEERHGTSPFHQGRDFTLMLLTDETCYRIAVDGQHCWEFVHRIPTFRVNSLYIDGRVQVDKIEFVDKISNFQPNAGYTTTLLYPSPYPNPEHVVPGIRPSIAVCPSYPMPGQGMGIIPPPEVTICPQPAYVPRPVVSNPPSTPVYNPKIPYAFSIPGGLRNGIMIHLTGRPFLTPTKFSLNLQSGSGQYPSPDIALHIDVRFTNHSIIRNSRLETRWEREETTKYTPKSKFPFQPAVNFELTIGVTTNKYLVALNGTQLAEFHHRLTPLSRFNTLYIEKDVIVDSIWVS